MSRYDVLAVGEYYCDLIFAGIEAPPRLGDEVIAQSLTVRPGGCYNMALGLTRLGVRTAWASDFGTDLFSRLVLEQAGADGIDPVGFRHADHSLQMVSAAFADRTERGFITYREAAVRPPDERLLREVSPRWLLQSFRYAPEWLAFMRAARAMGIRIFGDCSSAAEALATEGVREFIALCDVFSPNEAEACALAGTPSADDALEELAGIGPAIVMKRGARGAGAIIDGRRYDEPAVPVTVIDTVGAGDAFAAGFIAAAIWDLPFPERLRLAVGCGTLSTTGAGSSANPTAEQLKAFCARPRERALDPALVQ